MPYTLITVTYGGEVSHSRGYETLGMCEQAKSIALTGMTVEENEAEAKRAEDALADQMRKIEAAKTDKERMLACMGAASPSYNPNRGEAVVYLHGRWHLKHRHDIKFAQCVIEPDMEKPPAP